MYLCVFIESKINDSNKTRCRREKLGLFYYYQELRLLIKWYTVFETGLELATPKKVIAKSIMDMLRKERKRNYRLDKPLAEIRTKKDRGHSYYQKKKRNAIYIKIIIKEFNESQI